MHFIAIHQSAITSFLNGRIDSITGFDAVANVTITPDIIGAAADAPFDQIEDMIAHAKAKLGSSERLVQRLAQRRTLFKVYCFRKLLESNLSLFLTTAGPAHECSTFRCNYAWCGQCCIWQEAHLSDETIRHLRSPMITMNHSCLIHQHSKNVGSI